MTILGMARRRGSVLVSVWTAAALVAGLSRATSALADQPQSAPETFAIHGQATLVVQGLGELTAPYSGPNSLTPHQVKETWDATAYLGVRPWSGAEIWANPEFDQGFGLSNTLGVAGFPSGEAYKVGKSYPYLRLQRLFLRQTISLGGGSEQIAAAANQLAGRERHDRIVITLGKFAVGDVFDSNRYAHDPRGDFLNWSLIDTGSFDYAADAWGYSYGASAELYQGEWTLRAGLFNLSNVPNGEVLERDFSQNMLVGEIEHRHAIAGHPGAIRLTAFRNHGRFARLDEVLATGGALDPAPLRRTMNRSGLALNVEQEVTGSLGLFLRAGATNGAIETYDFTDIDRSLAVGAALSGSGWGRSSDTVGIAVVRNSISAIRRQFLSAGGLGLLVGDGQLRPADEQIVEAYYAWRPLAPLTVTVDFQHVANPAYNRDRGPANVLGLRIHLAG